MSKKAEILQAYGKKWQEAVEMEQFIRDASYVSNTEFIGQIEVWSLTPKIFAKLSIMQNAFLTAGSVITGGDILDFLWEVKKDKSMYKDQFAKALMQGMDIEKVGKDIARYFEWSFQDMSMGGKSSGSVPKYSTLASMVHALASAYHWSEEDIINIPYRRLFQYMRVIAKSNGDKSYMRNKSDDIKDDMMQAYNKQDKQDKQD